MPGKRWYPAKNGRKGYWRHFARFRPYTGGAEIRRNPKENTKAAAILLEQEMAAEYRKSGFLPSTDAMSFEELIQAYIEWSQSQGHLIDTVIGTLTRSRQFFKGVAVKSITPLMVQKFSTWMEQGALAPGSRKTYLMRLKAVLNYGKLIGVIPQNPADNISVKVPKEKRQAIPLEDVRRLLTETRWPVSAFCRIGFHTGLRAREILQLHKGHLADKSCEIHLTGAGTKGRYHREIPVSRDLMDWMQEQPEYIISENGQPFDYFKFWRSWLVELKRLKMPRYVMHQTRHTAATWMLTGANPASPFTVMKILGHKDIQTTMRYVSVFQEDKRKVIDDLACFLEKTTQIQHK